MKDRIRQLVNLQEIDQEILAIKRNLSRLPEEAKRLTAELRGKEERFAKLEQKYKALSLDVKEVELEITALESQLNRSQERMLEVKTQREYSAMKNQIAGLRADLRHSESSALELMEQVEELKSQVDKLSAEIEKERTEISEITALAKKQTNDSKSRFEELKAIRATLLKQIEPGDYEMYRKRIRPPQYTALSAVTNPGGLCSACNVQAEHQTLNRLFMGREIVFCSNCGRILYLSEKLD